MRLAVLDNLYTTVEDRAATDLFAAMMRVRASGYAAFYPNLYVPFDRSDFIATHYLVCADENDSLAPQGGYKKVSLERCDAYGVEFPILPWIAESEAHRHALVVGALVDEYRRSSRQLTYNGSLVLKPHARPRTVLRLLREVTAALAWEHYEQTRGAEITVAVLRTHTDAWFRELGYAPIMWDGKELPPLRHPGSAEDRFLVLLLREPGPWARACYEKHAEMLGARVRVGGA